VVLTVGLTWLVVDRVGVSLDDALSVSEAVPAFSLLRVAASVVVVLLALGASAGLWGVMVEELGGRPPNLLASMRIVFAANLGRYLPGKLWQIAGLAVLARREGVGAAVATTAGILGQAFSLAAVGALAAPVLLGPRGDLGTAGLAVLVALLGFAVLASVPRVLHGALALAFRIAREPPERIPRVRAFFAVRWLALYLLNWIAYGFAFLLFVRGLGLAAGSLQLVSAFAGSYLMGYVAVFAPAGLGVREGFMIAFLQPALGAAAVGVAILARVWITLAELVPAGVFALWEVRRTGLDRGSRASSAERP
jgi:glycosyltransferase 2 family protein